MSGTLALSWGRYGGFYAHRYRLCFGWLALTWLPLDLDDVLHEAYPEVFTQAATGEDAQATIGMGR